MPNELLVMLVSMTPIGELRAGIPLGLLLKMAPEAAFFWSEIGNILIAILILIFLPPVSSFLVKHSKWFDHFFTKLFQKTRHKHSKKMEKLGSIFLVIFVAIPLPGTGAWTGALLSFLFDIPFWKSVLLLFIGNLIAGTLVLLGFGGAMEVIKLFSPS